MCEPHHRATKQTTHKLKNNFTKEILALLQILGPTTDFTTWEFNKETEIPPGNLTLKASGIGNKETNSWKAQTKLSVDQDPVERSSDPTRV